MVLILDVGSELLVLLAAVCPSPGGPSGVVIARMQVWVDMIS